jgi:hypothetical protein
MSYSESILFVSRGGRTVPSDAELRAMFTVPDNFQFRGLQAHLTSILPFVLLRGYLKIKMYAGTINSRDKPSHRIQQFGK